MQLSDIYFIIKQLVIAYKSDKLKNQQEWQDKAQFSFIHQGFLWHSFDSAQSLHFSLKFWHSEETMHVQRGYLYTYSNNYSLKLRTVSGRWFSTTQLFQLVDATIAHVTARTTIFLHPFHILLAFTAFSPVFAKRMIINTLTGC